MPYDNTRVLKEDVLFRAGESTLSGVSDWEVKVIDYINRAYKELASGASSFLPEFVDDWWWRRFEAAFLMEPVYSDGTITSDGLTQMTFSTPPPSYAYVGARLRVFDSAVPSTTYVMRSHGLGAAAGVIDTNYAGTPSSPMTFQLMQNIYDVPAYFGPNEGSTKTFEVLNSPMTCADTGEPVYGVTPERLEELFPVHRLAPGAPQAFTMYDQVDKLTLVPGTTADQVSVARVRFSHAGLLDGKRLRIECSGRVRLEALIDSTNSIPLIPSEWRHVLADMALTYVFLDKNDDRANAAALGARTTLAAMLKENRRRLKKVDNRAGHIAPRQDKVRFRGPLRTQSGLIIG